MMFVLERGDRLGIEHFVVNERGDLNTANRVNLRPTLDGLVLGQDVIGGDTVTCVS